MVSVPGGKGVYVTGMRGRLGFFGGGGPLITWPVFGRFVSPTLTFQGGQTGPPEFSRKAGQRGVVKLGGG